MYDRRSELYMPVRPRVEVHHAELGSRDIIAGKTSAVHGRKQPQQMGPRITDIAFPAEL